MNGRTFTRLVHQASRDIEHAHLRALHGVYQRGLIDAADRASDQFALTAAADWQPPVEGAVLTVAQVAALATTLNKALSPIWTRLILEVGQKPLARIEIAWDVTHPLAQALLDQAGQRTGARLGEAAQFILRETLATAYNEGLDVRETAALIRSAMSDAAPWQAEMLARSDLNSLSNGASKAAAQLTGMSFKTWDATLDGVTRPEHAEAHGQTVSINDQFLVGGEEADYPGDPALSDAMAANCRCTLVYGETLDEAGGLLADGSIILPEMATKEQRRRKYERRAAHAVGKRSKDALVAAAIPVHHTGVVEGTWDGNAAMGKPTSAAEFRSITAWVDSNGDPSERQSYKFPHHANPGGPANINGVRNALARLPQANIPSGDVAGVRAHLEAHLNDFRRRQGENAVNPLQAMTAAARPIAFEGTAAIEGKISDDNSIAPRVLLPDALSWPEMPVSFMAQTVTAEGHDGAEVAGRVDEFARKRTTGRMRNINLSGEFTTPYGIDEIAPMVDDKTMRYVSIDLGAGEWALVERQTLNVVPDDEFDLARANDGAYAIGLTSGKIKAVTLVSTQAIEGAMIALTASADEFGVGIQDLGDGEAIAVARLDDFTVGPVELEGLVASPAPVAPPRAWFETPEPPGKMPLTITEDGRVYGLLAAWDTCHLSFLPSCVPPPKSASNYAYFHVCELDTAEGDTITVGKLMFSPGNGGHADRRLSASKASAHYDKTGMAAAYLRVTDGVHGIWAAGALNPDLTDEQRQEMRRQLRLNPPSGDWRPINGEYELICGLAVAVPGYPVARLSVVASADKLEMYDALIASSGVIEPEPAAVAALEHMGLIDEDLAAERQMHALAARAEGLEALASLVD